MSDFPAGLGILIGATIIGGGIVAGLIIAGTLIALGMLGAIK